MKKFNKAFLIALCALTTSLVGIACGGNDNDNSSPAETSSEVSIGSSVEETSSKEEATSSKEETSSEEVNSSVEETSSEEENSSVEDSVDMVEEFDVTINETEGVTIVGATMATEGMSYTFSVSLNTGYQKADAYAVTALVAGKSVTLVEDDGDYTIENVTGEIVITVSGVEKKTFKVTKNETLGVAYEGADTVVFGENYTFKVSFTDGYKAGEGFAVSINGKVITATETGEYVVENVKSGLVITVEGVEEVQYTATFTSAYADAVKNEQEGFKYEAENYTFKIALSGKYTQCADAIEVVYKVEGSDEEIAVTADSEGVYTIANPKANIEIIVKNVELNQYAVTFMRNAVVKYETMGTAGQALTEDQLNEALAALVGENEEFVAWREDVTMEIMDKAVFSVVTKAKNAFGALIEGNPLADGDTVTGEYSAAGYETVYTKANFTKGPFAEIDLSGYQTVKFAFKHTNSWVLFSGWTYYLDMRNTWVDVTMERTTSGDWTVTMEAPVNYNSKDGAEVVNPYVATLTGSTLAEVFATWENEAQASDLYVTELRGEAVQLYGEEIVAQAIAGSTQTTEVGPAIGFSSVYTYAKIPEGTSFADVDISGYSEVKFNMWLDEGYICIVGWGAYAENSGWGKQWVPITLTNNGGNWTVTIEALIAGANQNPYSYSASGKKLSEVLATWFDFVGSATIYITEVRGTAKEAAGPWGTLIENCAVNAGATLDTTVEAPEGFESAYVLGANTQFNNTIKSTADLSNYTEVRFAVKANKYFLINGWAVYFKESYTDWATVVMVNNGNNSWTVSIYADVWDGSKVHNPYVVDYTGTSLKEILSKWESSSDSVYVTELRGIAKEGAETPAGPWGTVVDSSMVISNYVTLDETSAAPEGFESVYAVNGIFSKDKKSTANLTNYTEVRFAVKSTKYFLIQGWSVYFRESFTDWATVVMKNNGDGTWEVTIYGEVFTGSAYANPYVTTGTGTSIAEILSAWESDEQATVYVTEVRGLAKMEK